MTFPAQYFTVFLRIITTSTPRLDVVEMCGFGWRILLAPSTPLILFIPHLCLEFDVGIFFELDALLLGV